MKKIKRMLLLIVLAFSMLSSSGCLSYNTYSNSKNEIAQRRAIVGQKIGEDGVGIGVNLLDVEALSIHPWKQLLSAGGDALMIWGASAATKYVEDKLNKDDDDDDDENSESKGSVDGTPLNSGDSNVINVTGDNNKIIIKGEKQSN